MQNKKTWFRQSLSLANFSGANPGLLLLLLTVLFWFPAKGELRAEEEWISLATTPKIAVWYRNRPGTEVKEYKAVGVITAPNWVVERVLEDSESYPKFMPHIAEVRVLQKMADGALVYQRASGPLISDRDYVIRVHVEERPSKAGPVFYREWKGVANSGVSERAKTVRLQVIEGSWTLAPEGENTRATYTAFADPGGAIPAGLMKLLNQSTLPKMFEAVEKRAAEPKYRQKPSAP